MNKLKMLCITKDATLKDALHQLNKTAQGMLFLVDSIVEFRFIQTITDGDIRRLLLQDYSLDSTLNNLPFHYSITSSSMYEARKLMQQHNLEHIPVLDEQGKLKNLLRKADIFSNILLSTPHIGEFERQYVNEAFETNWVAPLGPNVDAFEKEIADYLNVKAAVALNSGTAAIHLALILLDIKPGDVVFVSSFTFVASANPILYQGALPVFIDSDLDTWNMSSMALARALKDAKEQNNLPKAVIIVNLYGQSAHYDALCEICNDYNVPIIEDAAESLGAKYHNKPSGTFGELGVFSFNGNKIITTSGGGMLVSNNEELIEKARFLATQARDSATHYEHSALGYNYRMSNVLAGIGRGQLQVLDQRVNLRKNIYVQYKEAFKEYSFIEMMPEIVHGYSTHWLSCLTINPKYSTISPLEMLEHFKKHDIEARRTWKPMHRQPLYSKNLYYPHNTDFSVSDYLFEHGLCLPSGSNLNVDDVNRVVECMKERLTNESMMLD